MKYAKSTKTISLLPKEPDDICISDILKELDDGNINCSCGVNCEETQYEVKLSSSDWPSHDYVVRTILKKIRAPAVSI